MKAPSPLVQAEMLLKLFHVLHGKSVLEAQRRQTYQNIAEKMITLHLERQEQ